jgi:AcrR family transcriptional regulator
MAKNLDRKKILDLVRIQLGKFGFDKLTLADIGQPLGVKKTALYHYFPGGKWELIEAMLETEEENVIAKMRDAVARAADPREKLRAMVLAILEYTRGLRELLDVPREMGERLGVIYSNRELSFNRKMIEMIAAVIAEGQGEKIFRPMDPLHLAESLQFILHRLHLPLVYEGSQVSMEQRISEFLDLLFYGIVDREYNREQYWYDEHGRV